jgi:hypothetical protein
MTTARRSPWWIIFAIRVCAGLLAAFPVLAADSNWTTLSDGLDLGRFKAERATVAGDSIVTILRIDPTYWELKVLTVSGADEKYPLTAREWSETHGLVAAINAGMFQSDRRTHVGYMKCGAHINSSGVNNYYSALAFAPADSALPPYRLFDLPENATKREIERIAGQYAHVIQNLRLIKRPRENRWSQQKKMWSEAALGEDSEGRMLFIFCRSPYTMHDLNSILLDLPIDLVAAQHLEGGPEAQLYLSLGDTELELNGSYETNFNTNDANSIAWSIPNVIGIVRRER